MKKIATKCIVGLISAMVLSAGGAVIGVRVNDAVQDTKIDHLGKKMDKMDKKVDNIESILMNWSN